MKKILSACLLGVLLLFCGCAPEKKTSPTTIGQPVPALRFKDINGNDYFFNKFKGKVVVIANWATWCQYCLIELPYLQQLRTQYPPEKVEIVTILHDPENLDQAKQLIADDSLTLPVLLIGDHPMISQLASSGIPCSILIDRKGIIRFLHRGFAPADIKKYEDELNYLLGEP